MGAAELTSDKAPGYKSYKYIIQHPDFLGGRLTIRGTRFSVAQVLECLAAGMDLAEINDTYELQLSADVLREVLTVASELAEGAPRAAAG